MVALPPFLCMSSIPVTATHIIARVSIVLPPILSVYIEFLKDNTYHQSCVMLILIVTLISF
jgi:hypothetical protein